MLICFPNMDLIVSLYMCTVAFLPTFSMSLEESDCRMIKFVDEVDGKALYGNTIVEMTASNIDFCQLQCFLNNDCVSCNFGPSGSTGENICQLNNSTDRKRLQPRQGYTYLETENTCQSMPCLNNGKCQYGFTDKTFRCECLAGFDGEFCERNINDCASNPCKNNGTCNDQINGYNCSCEPGFYGMQCEESSESCDEIQRTDTKTEDESYTISTGSCLIQVYCDMTQTDQGWTLIARFSNNDSKHWMEDTGYWWYDKNEAFGETSDPSSNTDMISPAFWLVSGSEFKITRSDDPQHIPLLQTTDNCLGGQTFRSKVTSYGDFRNGRVWASKQQCLGNCSVQYGGKYRATEGFEEANCNGEIQSANKIGFWCKVQWDGSLMMIGGGGSNCSRADHGIGITAAKDLSFSDTGRGEVDFGNSAFNISPIKAYSLNLWLR